MKAAVVREHGAPDRLNFETDFPDPRPGPGDVIVAVKASSLNYHDVFTRRGMPGIKVPMPAIMGLDVAGEIAEVGPGVTELKAGELYSQAVGMVELLVMLGVLVIGAWMISTGRTTLGGEGLQHQDGTSHLVAATIPNCKANAGS